MSQWNNFKLSKLRIKSTQYKTIKWQLISNMKNENHLKTVKSFCARKFWYLPVNQSWPNILAMGCWWAKACLIYYACGPAQLCLTLCNPMNCCPPSSSVHGREEPVKSGYFLLQGIFPTPGLNLSLLCLLHCRWILYRWASEEAPWYTINVSEKTF